MAQTAEDILPKVKPNQKRDKKDAQKFYNELRHRWETDLGLTDQEVLVMKTLAWVLNITEDE